MKHFLLLGGLLLTTHLALAQETTWSINVTPTISYRLPQVRSVDPLTETIQLGEEAMHSFDFGVDLRTSLSDRWMIGAGLFYSQKGFSNLHVAAAYDQPTLSRAYVIDFMQDYLDIPFLATYSFRQNDTFRWYTLGGITNSLLLREKNDVAVRSAELSVSEVPGAVREQLQQPYLRAARSYSFGVQGGLGVQARVDGRTFIGLEALSKVMLTPLEDVTSGSQRHQYALGLNFRFVRSLR